MSSPLELQEEDEITRILFGLAVQAQKEIPKVVEGPRDRVVMIAGPTGCGKTELACLVAQALGGEIISADSMQVYRGMSIGTAKPPPELLERHPHYLVDMRDIADPFNSVDFYYEARQACQNILARNQVPVLAGGSGFYVRTFIFGPPEGPPSVPELRASIEKDIERFGIECVYEKLQKVDPKYAATITAKDRQKIARALEIIKLTGEPVSNLNWKGERYPRDYDFRCWFIYRPRDILYDRIDRRCDQMLEQGFLDEVRTLLDQGLEENQSAAHAIGYRQAIEYLRGRQPDYDTFVRSFKGASRQYAKRQFTWFRREPLFRWLDVELHDLETAADMICADYERK